MEEKIRVYGRLRDYVDNYRATIRDVKSMCKSLDLHVSDIGDLSCALLSYYWDKCEEHPKTHIQFRNEEKKEAFSILIPERSELMKDTFSRQLLTDNDGYSYFPHSKDYVADKNFQWTAFGCYLQAFKSKNEGYSPVLIDDACHIKALLSIDKFFDKKFYYEEYVMK
ncbi:MAG: hypothetical protein RL557_290 [archaeon]|jgi:hypothetical protein